MSDSIQCISPIDGSVYVQRTPLSLPEATDAVHRARLAQKDWARRPLQQRIDLVVAGIEALGAMNDEIVLELAWQMGRPVRYGGEFAGVKERTDYMAGIAGEALAHHDARTTTHPAGISEGRRGRCSLGN